MCPDIRVLHRTSLLAVCSMFKANNIENTDSDQTRNEPINRRGQIDCSGPFIVY